MTGTSAPKSSFGKEKDKNSIDHSDKENNDFLPVSVSFKPRKPSGKRLAAEILRHEEEKRMAEDHARREELKKYTHLALLQATSKQNDRVKKDNYHNLVSERLSEIEAHRKIMVAEENALIDAEDRMRKGRNRAGVSRPDLEVEVEKVPISFGNYKRDYSYIKDPLRQNTETEGNIHGRPSSAHRPLSGRKIRRAPGDSTEVMSKQTSKKHASFDADDILKTDLNEQKELHEILLGKDEAVMTEDERNVINFLRQNESSIRRQSVDSISSAKSTYTDPTAGLIGALDGGGMPLSLTRGIAAPVSGKATSIVKNTQQINNVSVEESGLIAASEPSISVPALLASSNIISLDDPEQGLANMQRVEVVVAPDECGTIEKGATLIENVSQKPDNEKASMVTTSNINCSSPDPTGTYSPTSSVDSIADSPSLKGGVFSQPSKVLGELGPAQHILKPAIGLSLNKATQSGKKNGSASIVGKIAAGSDQAKFSDLLIQPAQTNSSKKTKDKRTQNPISTSKILSVIEEETQSALLSRRSSPVALPVAASPESASAPFASGVPNHSLVPIAKAEEEANINIVCKTNSEFPHIFKPEYLEDGAQSSSEALNLREKFDQARAFDRRVSEQMGKNAAAAESAQTAQLLQLSSSAIYLRNDALEKRSSQMIAESNATDSSRRLNVSTNEMPHSTQKSNNIIIQNARLAKEFKLPAGGANAPLSASFRSEVGAPVHKESALKALKEQGRLSHTPLDRGSDPNHSFISNLAIDDSCLLSPLHGQMQSAPVSGRPASRGSPAHSSLRGVGPASVRESPPSTSDMQKKSLNITLFEQIETARPTAFASPNGVQNNFASNTEATEAEFRSLSQYLQHGKRDIPVIMPVASERLEVLGGNLDNSLANSLNASVDAPPKLPASVEIDVSQDFASVGAMIHFTDHSDSNVIQAARMHLSPVDHVMGVQMHAIDPKDALHSEPGLTTIKGAPQFDAFSRTLPFVRMESVDNFVSAQAQALLSNDSLSLSVLGLLGGAKEPNAARSGIMTLPTSKRAYLDTGAAQVSDKVLESSGAKVTVTGKLSSRLCAATPASRAKVKIRGIESWAQPYTTAENKRKAVKYEWMQLQERLKSAQSRFSSSTAVINSAAAVEELVEPAEQVLDSEVMKHFDELQNQMEKFRHIAHEDLTKGDVDYILRLHEKAKRAEAAFELRLRKIERKGQKAVLEIAQRTGLPEHEYLFPAIHIPVLESKEDSEKNHIMKNEVHSAERTAKSEHASTVKSNYENLVTVDSKVGNTDNKNYIKANAILSVDDSIDSKGLKTSWDPKHLTGETLGSNFATSSRAIDSDSGDAGWNQRRNISAIGTESLEMGSNLVLGLAESTLANTAKSEAPDSVHGNKVVFEASGAIAVRASALEASIFELGQLPVLEHQLNSHIQEGNSPGAHSKDEKQMYPLVYLNRNGNSSADNNLLGNGSVDTGSLYKDSVYSYSRNQTQTIHAPAAHGSMLKTGVGILRSKPGNKKNAHVEAKVVNMAALQRPRSAAAASGRRTNTHLQPNIVNVDNTLDQSASFLGKLNISGKGTNINNFHVNSALETHVDEAGVLNTYLINNSVPYKANVPSIRDTRGEVRAWENYRREQMLMKKTSSDQSNIAQTAARPFSAGANRKSSSKPSAAEVGLRMVNWKYGSLVRVDDTAAINFDQGLQQKHNTLGDDEFVLSALQNGYSMEQSVDSSKNWHYHSVSKPNDLLVGLLSESKLTNEEHSNIKIKEGKDYSPFRPSATKSDMKIVPVHDVEPVAPPVSYPKGYLEKGLQIIGDKPIILHARHLN